MRRTGEELSVRLRRRVCGLAFGFLAATSATASLAVLGCGGDPAAATAADSVDLPDRQVMFDVTHYMTARGVRTAYVEADTAYLAEDTTVVEMRGVRLRVYDDRGGDRALVTSESGELDNATERMIARGSVVVETTPGGQTIETEELHYYPRADSVWSDVETVMREEDRVVRGTGFVADGKFEDVTVLNARTEGGVRF